MKISINKTESSYEMILKRADGKFARLPLTEEELKDIRSQINEFMPPSTVPPIIRVGIEKLYELTHKTEKDVSKNPEQK